MSLSLIMILRDHIASIATTTVAPLLNGFNNPANKPRQADSSPPAPRPLRDACVEMSDKVDAFLSEDLESPLLRGVQARLRISMDVVVEALHRYPLEQISLSYNGGKDCLVLLIMILAGLARHFSLKPSSSPSSDSKPPNGDTTTQQPFPDDFQAVYIVSKHPFAEVDDFVASSSAEYHLDVTRYALPMKRGLEAYLADRPSVKAIFVGTRRTDPHGEKLTHFDPTDDGWPAFMRIHPVIDWHYAEIWAFIRHLGIPYCSLYDQGYTSLGGTQDTHPNPHLKKGDDNDGFRPAYELVADEEERSGRDW